MVRIDETGINGLLPRDDRGVLATRRGAYWPFPSIQSAAWSPFRRERLAVLARWILGVLWPWSVVGVCWSGDGSARDAYSKSGIRCMSLETKAEVATMAWFCEPHDCWVGSQSHPGRVRQLLSVFKVEGERRIYDDWSCHRQQPN